MNLGGPGRIVSLFLPFTNLRNLRNLWIALAFGSWPAPIHVTPARAGTAASLDELHLKRAVAEAG